MGNIFNGTTAQILSRVNAVAMLISPSGTEDRTGTPIFGGTVAQVISQLNYIALPVDASGNTSGHT